MRRTRRYSRTYARPGKVTALLPGAGGRRENSLGERTGIEGLKIADGLPHAHQGDRNSQLALDCQHDAAAGDGARVVSARRDSGRYFIVQEAGPAWELVEVTVQNGAVVRPTQLPKGPILVFRRLNP